MSRPSRRSPKPSGVPCASSGTASRRYARRTRSRRPAGPSPTEISDGRCNFRGGFPNRLCRGRASPRSRCRPSGSPDAAAPRGGARPEIPGKAVNPELGKHSVCAGFAGVGRASVRDSVGRLASRGNSIDEAPNPPGRPFAPCARALQPRRPRRRSALAEGETAGRAVPGRPRPRIGRPTASRSSPPCWPVAGSS